MRRSANHTIFDPDEVVDTAPVTPEGHRGQFWGDPRSRGGAETAPGSQGIEKTIPIDIEEVERQAQDPESDLKKTVFLGTDEIAVYTQRLKALSARPEETIRIDMDEILAHRSKARKAAEEVKTQKVQNARWPVVAVTVGLVVVGVFLLFV